MSVALSELLGGERLNLPLEQPNHDKMFLQWVIKQADRRTAAREKFEQKPESAIATLKNIKVDRLQVISPSRNVHYGDHVSQQIKFIGDEEYWRSVVLRGDPSKIVVDTAIHAVAKDYQNFIDELRWQRTGFAHEPVGFERDFDSEKAGDKIGFYILDNTRNPMTTYGIPKYPSFASVDFLVDSRDFSIRQFVGWPIEDPVAKSIGFEDMLTYAKRFGELVDQNATSATVKI